MRSTKLTAHLYPFATPHIHSHSEEGASFTGEQMRRVVDAAEAGVRDRMECKVLKAASMVRAAKLTKIQYKYFMNLLLVNFQNLAY